LLKILQRHVGGLQERREIMKQEREKVDNPRAAAALLSNANNEQSSQFTRTNFSINAFIIKQQHNITTHLSVAIAGSKRVKC
jgi:hypothetical protein